MKKRYIIYFLMIVATGFFTACSDKLDLDPDGRISIDNVFLDQYKTMGYLNSCYSHSPAPYMDRASVCDEAEDADDNTSGSRYTAWYTGAVNASSFAGYSVDGSPWDGLYQGIRKCNVFLENLETSNVSSSDDEKQCWSAEAHTLRALYYLQLIKRYGGVPILDKSFAIDHDFSADKKSTFSEVVKFIIADCDSALTAPDTENGFHWEVYDNENGKMNPAIAYAIESEAVTYAASALWSDGTYSWEDATKINGKALSECLSHDYELFNNEPVDNAAQNPYALYFLTKSNDQRSVDKETIFQCGGTMAVWKYAGLPTTEGMIKSGPCPTQDLVDCYEMAATGEAPITGYTDADHLQPIINNASGYDPANPYEGRDPRFYASIYYNGAQISLAAVQSRDDSYNISIGDGAQVNQIDVTNIDDYKELVSTGGDPFISTGVLQADLDSPPSIILTFEYKSPTGCPSPQIFYETPAGAWNGGKQQMLNNIPVSTEWTTFTQNISSGAGAAGWGAKGDNLRFDYTNSNDSKILDIKNMRILVISAGSQTTVQSYVGGAEGISQTLRTHTHTGYYQRKFNNWKSNESTNADGAIRMFRLAELYMNFAESAYQSNGPDEEISIGSGITMSARDAVNAVRKRAGMPDFPSGMSVDDFKAKYRNERRVEFAFEDFRFFDVRRWNIIDKTDKFVTGMEITKEPSGYIYKRFKFDDRNCYSEKWLRYPISQSEVDKVLNATGVNWQNVGW